MRAERFEAPGGVRVRLAGAIDDKLPVTGLSAPGGILVLDLDQVPAISSSGIKAWRAMISELRADYYCFVGCRPAVLSQFNMVAGFAGRGELVSFYLPYVCRSCGHHQEHLLDCRRHFDVVASLSPPAIRCARCGSPMEFDDVASSYLAYASTMRAPSPPPVATALIDSASAGASAPFKVQKEIVGSLTVLWLSGRLEGRVNFKRLADGLENEVLLFAEGVTSVTPKGVERLSSLLNSTSLRPYLARVRPSLVEALLSIPEGLGRSGVLSLLLAHRCVNCRREIETEVDPVSLAQARSPECPSCTRPMLPTIGPEIMTGLASLPLRPPGEAVRTFLAANPRAPSTSQGESAPHAEPAPTSSSGDEPFDGYRVLRSIAKGGMAEMLLARQERPGGFDRLVAIKRILPHLAADRQFVEMFLREARLAARISHPNVVQIYELGQTNDRFYIVMEYVRGWDLHTVLRACEVRRRAMPVELACRVVSDVCAALSAAHDSTDEENRPMAIVHRDVTPHNVMISVDGVVKLTDFGIAKAADSLDLTRAGAIKGKVSYLSPEQVRRAGEPVDERSDLFSAGIILFECLARTRLFTRETDLETMEAILGAPIPQVERPEVPRELQACLERALARDRDRRYPSASDFRADLEPFLAQAAGALGAQRLAEWVSDLLGPAAIEPRNEPPALLEATQVPLPSSVRARTSSEKPTQPPRRPVSTAPKR